VRSKIGDVFCFSRKSENLDLMELKKADLSKMFSQKNYLIATKFPEKRADVKL